MAQQLDQRYQFGDLLRRWRQDRGVSQLALGSDADVSPRHLSFVETGRSAPSRGLVLRLAEHLEIPLRGRNELLLAAGFAPEFSQ
ncbi:MAG TPA: helix-turn-helix transcriptional regulator, partial [Streptosporangiaceae bacterium]|nr:helix-turn-helix transcriptional regulator [Streptosporangiaceae bacterium]